MIKKKTVVLPIHATCHTITLYHIKKQVLAMTDGSKSGDLEQQPEKLSEPKKVNLADAIRKQLEQKKKAQAESKGNTTQRAGNMTGRSQMTKKVNNQRRRTGGS